MKLLKPGFRFIHSALPGFMRRNLDIAAVSLQDTWHNWRLPAYRVSGLLAGNDGRGSLVYFGNLPQYGSWISRIFSETQEPEPLGSVRLIDVCRHKGSWAENDLLLCPVNLLTQTLFICLGWKIIPKYVTCSIDTRKPTAEIFRSRDARRIKNTAKKHYKFRVLSLDTSFEEFYFHMLVPTIMERHGKQGHISSFDKMRANIEDGFLFAAYLESDWVGATLVIRQNPKVLRAANIGWRLGDERLLKEHIASALRSELIVYTKDHGYESLDLGSSNPFPSDGSLTSKLKWNAEIDLPRVEYNEGKVEGVRSYLALSVNLDSPAARSMMKNTPVFERYRGTLRVIGWNAEVAPQFRRIVRNGLPWVNLAEHQNETLS